MSGRVTSSGNMPAVCSNSVRRRLGLAGAEAFGDAGQIPDRIDRDLHHRDTAVRVHDLAVGASGAWPASAARISGRSSRARVTAMLGRMSTPSAISLPKFSATRWPQGSSATMRLRVAPLRERPDGRGRKGVGEIGTADRIERAGRDRERAIHRIGAAMAADHVAIRRPRHRADDRAARARIRSTPVDRERMLGAGLGMRGEADMVGSVRAAHRLISNGVPKRQRPAGPTGLLLSCYESGALAPPDLVEQL